MGMTYLQLMDRVPDEASAYRFLEEMIWQGRPVCPHCGSTAEHYFLTPKAPGGRRTRTGAVSQRRLWKCSEKACRKQFSVLTGTVFHGTKVSVRIIVLVIFEMVSAKNGVAAYEIERRYGLHTDTAWSLLQRVREAMQLDYADPMVGTIISDETWVGGDPKNQHRKPIEPELLKPGHSRVRTDKSPVLSLVNADTGEVRSKVVRDVSGHTLRKVIAANVEMGQSHLHTDAASAYLPVGREFLSHQSVAHERGEYVRDAVSTNRAEGYFSQLKRSISGTHHHVSKRHLPAYLGEFDFRYSTCKISDSARMEMLLAQLAGTRF